MLIFKKDPYHKEYQNWMYLNFSRFNEKTLIEAYISLFILKSMRRINIWIYKAST